MCICLLPLKHLNYTLVAVHEDKLRDKLQKKMPVPVYWESTHEAEDLQRLDHLYTVHYPDPEGKGEHRRSFGGDVIQGTQGSCSTPSIVCMTLQHTYVDIHTCRSLTCLHTKLYRSYCSTPAFQVPLSSVQCLLGMALKELPYSKQLRN